jgi:hypothetical protein
MYPSRLTRDNGYGTFSKEKCDVIKSKQSEWLSISPEYMQEYNDVLKEGYDSFIRQLEQEAKIQKSEIGKERLLAYRDQILQHDLPTYKDYALYHTNLVP